MLDMELNLDILSLARFFELIKYDLFCRLQRLFALEFREIIKFQILTLF